MVRALIIGLVRFALRTFYRVRSMGGEVPADGPVILVANHPNALADPVMVMIASRRPVRFLGKEPLLRMPVLGWIIRTIGMIPVYRPQDGADTQKNAEAFRAVEEALHESSLIAIFPEGKSHDEPALQRLKTGAARMALGADPTRAGEVRIVPVGLVYADKPKFRSKAAIWIGEPVDGGDLRAGIHDEDSHWKAVEELTARVDRGLQQVTVNLDAWEDWELLLLAQRIWRPARGERRVERLSALASAARTLRRSDPEQFESLARRVDALRLALDELGLPADRLDQHYRPWKVLRYLLRELATIALGAPLTLAALLFWLPLYLVVKIGVRLGRPSRDLHATVKVLAFATLFPFYLGTLATLVGLRFGAAYGLALAIAAPLLGRLALPVFEEHLRLVREIRRFLRHVTASRMRRQLIAERDAIAAQFDALADGGTSPARGA